MKTMFRGKIVSDDTPHDRTRGANPYGINRVSLKVARRNSSGRWEGWENSRSLLLRMDEIGKRGLTITALKIGPVLHKEAHCRALNLYLVAGGGLKYFRRLVQPWSYTRSAVTGLLSRIGIPNDHVIRIQPSHQIPTGFGDASGTTTHRRLSSPRGK